MKLKLLLSACFMLLLLYLLYANRFLTSLKSPSTTTICNIESSHALLASNDEAYMLQSIKTTIERHELAPQKMRFDEQSIAHYRQGIVAFGRDSNLNESELIEEASYDANVLVASSICFLHLQSYAMTRSDVKKMKEEDGQGESFLAYLRSQLRRNATRSGGAGACSPFIVLSDIDFDTLAAERRQKEVLEPNQSCLYLTKVDIDTYGVKPLVAAVYARPLRAVRGQSFHAPQPSRLTLLAALSPFPQSYGHVNQPLWAIIRLLQRLKLGPGQPLDLLATRSVDDYFQFPHSTNRWRIPASFAKFQHVNLRRLWYVHPLPYEPRSVSENDNDDAAAAPLVLDNENRHVETKEPICFINSFVAGTGYLAHGEKGASMLGLNILEERRACDYVRSHALAALLPARHPQHRWSLLPRVFIAQRNAGELQRRFDKSTIQTLRQFGQLLHRRRCIEFIDELIPLEGMSLIDTIDLFSTINVLWTPHGSQEANCQYMPADSTIFEFQSLTKPPWKEWFALSYLEACSIRHVYVPGSVDLKSGRLVVSNVTWFFERMLQLLPLCNVELRDIHEL